MFVTARNASAAIMHAQHGECSAKPNLSLSHRLRQKQVISFHWRSQKF